jgi:hypothetical protein
MGAIAPPLAVADRDAINDDAVGLGFEADVGESWPVD